MSEEEGLSKQEKRVIVMVVILIVCAMVGITSALFLGKDDAPIEEISEDVIQSETGLQIDLTPKSPEPPKR